MTLNDLVAHARQRLVAAGLRDGEAGLDAEVLARFALGWDRATYLSNRLEPAPEAFAARYEPLLSRRERREPVGFITGTREFWGLDFEVSGAVLIPRPDTELIVEEAVALLGGEPPARIVDVGTGSGCLAVALALEFPAARVTATDISPDALAVARRNASRHGVEGRVRFVRTNFLDGIRGPADLIVANPPYVPAGAAPGLQPEVRDYEPGLALFSGIDGLDATRELLLETGSCLRAGGWLVMEFGLGQEDELRREVARHAHFSVARIRDDLQGIARVAAVRHTPAGVPVAERI